jgi:uncharacterized protein (DUF2461 family)
MAEFEVPTMKRVPRGFAADSPAADLISTTRWGVSATLPAEVAIKPTLLKEITRRFVLAAPMVHFLNAGIATARPARLKSPTARIAHEDLRGE